MKKIHQSWFVVAFCFGVVIGAIFAAIFDVSKLELQVLMWILLALMVVSYFEPRAIFVAVAVFAGVVVIFCRVNCVATMGESGFSRMAVSFREWFSERILRVMNKDGPEVKLGLAYLLGMKTGLPNNLEEALGAVGLTYMVVASGAHLSILVEASKKIFGKLSRFTTVLYSTLLIWIFVAMVGFTPSIMRAGLMATLTLIAGYSGRKIESWRIILMVAAATLLINPGFITNLGWLFSFAAFFGIMVLSPIFAKFFYGEKKPGFIASTVLSTIAATLMTLPITLYFFGQVSLISIVANLLILPTLPYAMGLVFFSGVVAGIPGISEVVAFLATKILEFHIAVVEFFGGMEPFLVRIEKGKWQVFLIYLVVVLTIVEFYGRSWYRRFRHRDFYRNFEPPLDHVHR